MKIRDCYAHLAQLWADELVVCSAATPSGEWYRATESRESFYLQASMGISSMFTLGVALSLPQARVWNFDGDGALMMNIGVLATEAEVNPSNMVHFLLANRVYGATKQHPFPNCDKVDFVGLARASGIERVFSFDDIDTFRAEIGGILKEPKYAFVVLELESEPGLEQEVPIDGPELKYSFARHVEQQFGVQVFGEWGY
jgi:sulfopyruvate decarboxylase subunit beta